MPEKKRRSARPINRDPAPESIAQRAYARWLARGCPTTDGLEDWFAAQTELEREHGKPTARTARSALAG
jgi:hypothetical protein